MHEALSDKGFKFDKYGQKTQWPLYKDSEGKAVYVKPDNGWQYYPMGTHGQNSHGSSEGTGVKDMAQTVSLPFEKPASATSLSSPTSSNAITSEEKTKFTALSQLPEEGMGSALGKLPTGQQFGGEPISYIQSEYRSIYVR